MKFIIYDKNKFLHSVRKTEFELVFDQIDLITNNLSVLELGCGTGYQLVLLNELFKSTTGIDIDNKCFEPIRSKQIKLYDGINIPFENKMFDVIFSSNTLEHIPNIEIYDKEIKRILADNGYCIHILPSHYWRLWSILGHYLILPKIVFQRFKKLVKIKREVILNNPQPGNKSTKNKISKEVLNFIFPSRHGVRGNRFSEYNLFKPKTWIAFFKKNNWDIVNCSPVGLFYTGHSILGSKLSIKNRIRISKITGSSCYCYLLMKR